MTARGSVAPRSVRTRVIIQLAHSAICSCAVKSSPASGCSFLALPYSRACALRCHAGNPGQPLDMTSCLYDRRHAGADARGEGNGGDG
jgi:hypothetical protein